MRTARRRGKTTRHGRSAAPFLGVPQAVRRGADLPYQPLSVLRRPRLLRGPFTYREYARINDRAERAGDFRRYELIDGDIYVSPSPILLHQVVVMRLTALLLAHVAARAPALFVLADFNSRLARDTNCEPDLAVVERKDLARLEKLALEVPPRVVIEVLSPSTKSWDRKKKRDRYARARVPEYWIVDPRGRSVARYDAPYEGAEPSRVFVEGERFESRMLRGFELDVAGLFAPVA